MTISTHDATLPTDAIGLGLRPVHYQEILASPPPVQFFEALSENYLHTGGRPLRFLDRIAERHTIVLHGVSMNIAGTDRLDRAHLRALKALQRRCGALCISDHLCWSAVDGVHLHDLLPIPYTERVLDHVVRRVRAAQDELEQPLVLENPSTYLQFAGADFDEAQFLAELVARTDCQLLIDVNNVFVSANNHAFDPRAYLRTLPWSHVAYLHVAGHTVLPTHRLDTHDRPVCDDVWRLHAYARALSGGRPTVLERDDAIPPLAELVAEVTHARTVAAPAARGVAS